MRIVPTAGSTEVLETPETLLMALHRLLATPEHLMPAAPELLALFLPKHLPLHDLPRELKRLIASGHLRQVIVGKEAHIALPSTPLIYPPPNITAPPASLDRAFEDTIQVDLESERLLLYRVAIVVQLLITSLLVRALWLWTVEL